MKPEPIIVTLLPAGPVVGLNELMTGGGGTAKLSELVAVPYGVVTLMGPVVAPLGTEVVIWLSELTVNVAEVPLKFTAVAPVKPEPEMVTPAPTNPLVGENELIAGPFGVTVKLPELVPVPNDVLTLIGPVVAPVGTEAVTWVFELTVKPVDVPLNFTATAPVNQVPVIVTLAPPAGPLVGENEVMLGAG